MEDPGDCKNDWFTQDWVTVYTEDVSYTDAAGVQGLQVVIGGRTYGNSPSGFFSGTDEWGGKACSNLLSSCFYEKERHIYELECQQGC